MRRSKVLEQLRSGKPAFSVKSNLADPRAIEIGCAYGFDCMWICHEHIPSDWLRIEDMVRAAKLHDVDAMVRVARGSYSDYIWPFEMDASGIMVPHLMSADEARWVVRMTRFHPIGRRPWDGGNLDGFFCQIPPEDYMKGSNEEKFVACQIEDPEPMDELDEIAAVPGYDILFFGPGDFSHGIGKPGQPNAPEVVEARKAVAAAARKHGKFAATMGSIEAIPQLMEEGFQFFSVAADVIGLCNYYGQVAEALVDRGLMDRK